MQARRWRPLAGWALVAVLGLLLAGCAIGGDTGDMPQNFLDPAPGSIAQEQDALWNRVFPIAVAVFILVQGAIIYAVVRFRARGQDDALPRQIAGNTRLEILWTVIPAVILLAFVAPPMLQTLFRLGIVGEDVMNVRVIAKQYWWEFEYSDPEQQGVVIANQLHIPVGTEIQLDMQSVSPIISYEPQTTAEGADVQPRGDVALGVIHSFWVPKLAGKTDVVPGHTREMALIAEVPGVYSGQCAEFCGLSHPNMRFSVVAMEQADFDAWIEEQAQPAEELTQGDQVEGEPGDPFAGQDLFVTQQCIGCHAIAGHPQNADARVGPDLTHFNSRDLFAGIFENDNDDDLRAWLRNPQEAKPGAQMPNLNLSDEQIDDLVAYLRTLD